MPLLGINQDSFCKPEGGFPTFEDMIRGIAELGLNLFEFCPEYLELTPDALTPSRRKAALALARSLNVKLIIHASFMCPNICLIHEPLRVESLRQLKREIELAHDLESDVITIHPGPPRGHVRWYPAQYFWDMMKRSYEELLAFAAPLGVRICSENLNPDFIGTEETLARLFSELDAPGFGLTFDFGHHNLIYKERPLEERTDLMVRMLQRFAERIWVLHIHDNRSERDDHDTVGSGHIRFDAGIPEVLRLGIQAYWSMELAGIEAARVSKLRLLTITNG